MAQHPNTHPNIHVNRRSLTVAQAIPLSARMEEILPLLPSQPPAFPEKPFPDRIRRNFASSHHLLT